MKNMESRNQCEAAITGSSTSTQKFNKAEGKEPLKEVIVGVNEDPSPLHNVQGNHSSYGASVTVPHDVRVRYIKLHKAAMRGDWKTAENIIKDQEDILTAKITCNKEIVLHIAVTGKHKEFVRNLIGKMDKENLAIKDKYGNTALSLAATLGVLEIAKMLIKKNPILPNISGRGDLTPIHAAALFGHGEMVKDLYPITTFVKIDDKFISLFHAMISADLYDVALSMWKEKKGNALACARNPNNETALHLMARKHSNKKPLNKFKKLANSIKGFFCEEKMKPYAHQLVEELWKKVLELTEKEVSDFLKSPPQLHFEAAESGNDEFLVILIRSYPELIKMTDDKGQSLFHIAALNRHERVFNLIYEIGGIKTFIGARRVHNPSVAPQGESGASSSVAPQAESGACSSVAPQAESGASPPIKRKLKNNLLHLVARLPPQDRLQVVSGAALQMQRELLWFKAVKEIVPRSYIKDKNNDGKTANDIFTEEHENLRKEGEKWMKETATACMLVATLIVTVVFASAFALPGGNDDKNGFPRFKVNNWFAVFIISDSVALFSSVISVGIFLTIMTSRYAEKDFKQTLPTKLMSGLFTLFVSVISMVIAFTATMILYRDKEIEWSLILIICLAFFTAILVILLPIRLFYVTFRAAFSSKSLFYRRKSSLFL